VFAALVTQHATRIRHFVICGLPSYITFFSHYLIKGTEKKVTEHKRVFHFLFNFCLKRFPLWEKLNEIWSKIERDMVKN
jgi:hypothetical protein